MLARIKCISLASRGLFDSPVSCSDVDGKEGFIGAGALVPFTCCEFCVFGCVVDAVGGLGFGAPEADAVVGGVEIPFGMFSAAGEAIFALAGGRVSARSSAVEVL